MKNIGGRGVLWLTRCPVMEPVSRSAPRRATITDSYSVGRDLLPLRTRRSLSIPSDERVVRVPTRSGPSGADRDFRSSRKDSHFRLRADDEAEPWKQMSCLAVLTVERG